MSILLRIILMPLLISNAYWNLEWQDEFNNNQLDLKNWEIDEGDELAKRCDSQNIGRINCNTKSNRNIRLIDGTLALTAISEKHPNNKYTSAWIRTNKTLTYGRIDIRAALPIGKMLSPWVKLVPPKYKGKDGGVKSNQVIVFYSAHMNYVKYGESIQGVKGGHINDFLVTGNINEFHTYSIEWNQTDLIWRFDGEQTNWLNLSQAKSFMDHPLVLIFYLRVGGEPFRKEVLTPEEAMEWVCSLFILDYVRYYIWSDSETEQLDSKPMSETDAKKSVEICKVVMDEIRPKAEGSRSSSSINMTTVISILCLLFLLILTPLIAWLVIRMKKIRDPSRQPTQETDFYDDINQSMEMYEEIPQKSTYEYADYQLNSNGNYYSKADAPPVLADDENDPDYLVMNKKTLKREDSSQYV